MVDEAKPPEPVDYSSRESADPAQRSFFDSLHLGEGYVLFGIDLDSLEKSEPDSWPVAIVEKGGSWSRLAEIVHSKSRALLALLGPQEENLMLRQWREEPQEWGDLPLEVIHHPENATHQFADLGLCYMQGNFAFGLLVCLARNAAVETRLVTLHNAGLSKLIATFETEREAKVQAAQAMLTEGERNVLIWCGNGKTSFEISRILGLSEHTVNHYIAAAVRKLDATNRTHAIAKAIKRNIIDIDDVS